MREDSRLCSTLPALVITAVLIPTRADFSCSRCMECFLPFTNQEIDEGEASEGIGPPPAKKSVQEQSYQQYAGHVGAGDATCGISFECGTSNAFCDPKFPLPQERHDDGRRDGKAHSPPG